MALTTLTGTTSASALNNNFLDKIATLNTTNRSAGKDYQYELKVLSLLNSLNEAKRSLDFVAPDDVQVVTLGVGFFNPSAVSRSVKVALTAISSEGVEVSKYLTDQTVEATASGATAAEHLSTRTDFRSLAYDLILFKGATYRLTLTRTDANGVAVDSANAFLVLRQFRRYK